MQKIEDEKLLELIDGRLPAAEAKELKNQFELDPALKARYQELALVNTDLGQLPVHEAGSNLESRIMATISNLSLEPSFSKSRWISLIIIAVAFAGGIYLLSFGLEVSILESLQGLSPSVIDNQPVVNLTLESIDSNLLLNGFMYLNAFICLFLLEKSVMRPFFKNRRHNYSV